MIIIDSLRYDHLNANGFRRETAPNIAQLMSESVSFDNAISPSNYTGLSVPAMFTGKHPSHIHDPHPLNFWIPEEEKTLAETFSDAGFNTFLWSANMHLKKKGFAQGFKSIFTDYLQTQGIVSIEGIIRQINKQYQPSESPEFHYIHTMDVHFPYTPPYPYEWQFTSRDNVYVGEISSTGVPMNDLNERIESSLAYYAESHDLKFEDIKHLKDLYDGSIRYTDTYLPKLLESLNYNPDSDLLILTADHGEQFYSHGWWGHGRMLLPQEIHVPLIVKHPDFTAHSVSGSTSLIDLYPTLCELYGLESPDHLAGKSITSALKGEQNLDRFVYSEGFDPKNSGASIVGTEYLYYFQANRSIMQPWFLWPFQQSLYNIATDPNCEVNLADSDPQRTKIMHDMLIKMNPRWKPYSWDKIQQPSEPFTLGENLFKAGVLRHVTDGKKTIPPEQMAGEGTILNEAQPEFATIATIEEPGHPHVITIDYNVLSGSARFELFEKGDDEPIWIFNITNTSQVPRHLTAHVDIDSDSVFFHAKALQGGETRVAHIQLQRLIIPEITPQPAETVYQHKTSDPAVVDILTDSEKEALEAIGYVQ